MHVHVSRRTISPLALGKILVFVNRAENHALLNVIARRDETQYCKKQEKHLTSQYLGADGVSDRYQAVNTTNGGTIEFRLFASTRRPWKAVASLEAVQAIVTFCEQTSTRALGVVDFLDWLRKRQSQFPQLVKLLERDGAYSIRPPRRAKRQPINVNV